ncbi:Protein of unknown function DUF506 [Macleaya cordata]|uniref:DUF506 domain-containing protein n=1 Tax=Macleaya cordata TaxID=56857 RepID=A0A200QE35_MACCD|nr:Protein of unknown function DUF506 [Macleaya cordata]
MIWTAGEEFTAAGRRRKGRRSEVGRPPESRSPERRLPVAGVEVAGRWVPEETETALSTNRDSNKTPTRPFVRADYALQPDAWAPQPNHHLSQVEYSTEMIEDLLNPKRNRSDSFRLFLLNHVSKAVTIFSSLGSNNKEIFRRKVMFYLRESGYNAGICKTKWESSGGLTAGNYEFIDVIRSESSDGATCQVRYFIDVDFVGEFDIARPTEQYSKLLKVLPRVYVGRSEELKQIVKLMCDAAKRSLKCRELYLSPWRKNRYMQAKWFGPYKRTVNQIPSSSSFPLGFDSNKFAVKCQTSVGFNVVGGNCNGNGRFCIPAATRTR